MIGLSTKISRKWCTVEGRRGVQSYVDFVQDLESSVSGKSQAEVTNYHSYLTTEA